jgi:cytochrome P450
MCLMLWHHPRFCVGAALAMAEMKVFLAVLLRDYDFTADNNTTWRQAVGSVPDNGLPLSLTPLASA